MNIKDLSVGVNENWHGTHSLRCIDCNFVTMGNHAVKRRHTPIWIELIFDLLNGFSFCEPRRRIAVSCLQPQKLLQFLIVSSECCRLSLTMWFPSFSTSCGNFFSKRPANTRPHEKWNLMFAKLCSCYYSPRHEAAATFFALHTHWHGTHSSQCNEFFSADTFLVSCLGWSFALETKDWAGWWPWAQLGKKMLILTNCKLSVACFGNPVSGVMECVLCDDCGA